MKKFWRWCWIVGALLVGAPASAEPMHPDSIRYVRVDAGGSGDGRENTVDRAWTLAQANSGATAGFTVLIGPGNYSTAINPSNSGAELAPFNSIYSGRIVFTGRTSNAAACSLSGITLLRPNVTIKHVTIKQNSSITVGALRLNGSSTVSSDSLYGLILRRGSGGFLSFGMQNGVVAENTLYVGTGAIWILGDGATGWAAGGGEARNTSGVCVPSNSCPGAINTTAPQNNIFRNNTVILEGVKKGQRRFLVSGHAVSTTIDSNFVKVYFDSAGSTSSESGIGFELSRAYNTIIRDNRWHFEADGNHNEYWRSFALRDSTYGTRILRDTVYSGMNLDGLPSMSTNRANINFTMGQTGTECCNPSSTAGAWDTNIDSCRFIGSGGVVAQNASLRQINFRANVVVSLAGIALDLGEVTANAANFSRNTIVAYGGNLAFSRRGDFTSQLTLKENIIVCDSLQRTVPADTTANGLCSSWARGGGLFFGENVTSNRINNNLYWSRTGTAYKYKTAVRDSLIHWTWKGFFPPDSTRGSGACNNNGIFWRPASDMGSLFGPPQFADSTAGTSFNGRPIHGGWATLVSSPSGYVGALAPTDTVAPSVPTGFSATASGANVDKSFTWYEAGDDSLFMSADSVFVCERASVDSSRIDNTNFRDYIVYGFASGIPNTQRTYTCSAVSGVEVPNNEPWSGCGSEAILPGDIIGFVRIVTKDEDGNLSFSQTLQLTWSP